MQLKVLYHGNCFDGCASAALFSRFFVEREGARLDAVRFVPLHHQQGDSFPRDAFDGDVNACLDFRFSPSPQLHWWFDHHASAFCSPADRAAFERDVTGHKFWNPAAPSCAGFVARTLAERFGWTAADLADLVSWADLIDAARFPSAAMAVRLEEPALRIMTLLEATRDPAIPTRLIEAMQRRPLADIAAEPWVTGPLGPILERHRGAIETVRRLAPKAGSTARTSSSCTSSSRTRVTPSSSRRTRSAPRCRSARTRGRASPGRTTSRSCASGTGAVAIPSSERSHSMGSR
jgi:hypothetical protein